MDKRLNHIIKEVLKEEKILVPRNLETRDEEYKRVIYKKIQDYVKKGSKGDLNFPQSPITKLPDNFVKVGGYLNLNYSQIQSLSNLKIVKGGLYLEKTPIKFLGNLQKVGGSLYLWGSQIQSLDNLQTVGGYLNLRYTPIKSLDNLQKIGGSLDLNYSQIESLGNLQTIGEDLDLQNTPLSKKYSREEIFQMIKNKKIEVEGRIFT